MNQQEKAEKEIDVYSWMKSKGFDRRACKDIAPIIVEYIAENGTQKTSTDLDSIISRVSSMKDDSGRAGCTYGDTNYDSESAVYGYNLAIGEIVNILSHRKTMCQATPQQRDIHKEL